MAYQVSTPRLNFDVLMGIIANIQRKRDISSFMKTCKTLYRPAISHILYDGVLLRSISEATSFCQFMLAEHWNKDRIRHLSHLSIEIYFHEDENYGRLPFTLAGTIKGAVHLESLQMQYLDSLLNVEGGESVFEVLHDLNSHCKLKKLTLQEVADGAVHLVGSMVPSFITDLSLSYDFEMLSPDPSPVLQSLKSTITTLNMEWIDPRSFGVRCPRLHTLSLDTHYSVAIPVLVRAFPNLCRLSVNNETESYDEDEILQLRLTNQIGLAHPAGSWTHLRYLRGDTNQLYIMGLSCPVYELDVDVSKILIVHRVLQLFSDVSPQMIDLHILIYRGHFSLENVKEFLPTAIQVLNSKNSCSHLSLRLQLSGYRTDIQGFVVSTPTPSPTL